MTALIHNLKQAGTSGVPKTTDSPVTNLPLRECTVVLKQATQDCLDQPTAGAHSHKACPFSVGLPPSTESHTQRHTTVPKKKTTVTLYLHRAVQTALTLAHRVVLHLQSKKNKNRCATRQQTETTKGGHYNSLPTVQNASYLLHVHPS